MIKLAILIGISAYVYTNWLTEPHQVLHKPYMWLKQIFKYDDREENGQPIHWMFMILIHCEKCVAGQFSLWYYLIFNYQDYDFFTHLFFITTSIFAAGTVKAIYNRITNETNNGN